MNKPGRYSDLSTLPIIVTATIVLACIIFGTLTWMLVLAYGNNATPIIINVTMDGDMAKVVGAITGPPSIAFALWAACKYVF